METPNRIDALTLLDLPRKRRAEVMGTFTTSELTQVQRELTVFRFHGERFRGSDAVGIAVFLSFAVYVVASLWFASWGHVNVVVHAGAAVCFFASLAFGGIAWWTVLTELSSWLRGEHRSYRGREFKDQVQNMLTDRKVQELLTRSQEITK